MVSFGNLISFFDHFIGSDKMVLRIIFPYKEISCPKIAS